MNPIVPPLKMNHTIPKQFDMLWILGAPQKNKNLGATFNPWCGESEKNMNPKHFQLKKNPNFQAL